jgi:hypothetical protein
MDSQQNEHTLTINNYRLAISIKKLSQIVVALLLVILVFALSFTIPHAGIFADESIKPFFELGKYTLIFLCIVFAMLYWVKAQKNYYCQNSVPFLIMLVFIFYIYITSFWNPFPSSSEASLGVMFFNLVQFVLIYCLIAISGTSRKMRLHRFAMFLAYLAFFSTLTGIPEIVTEPLGHRVVGALGNSTSFGLVSVLGFLSFFHLEKQTIKKRRILHYLKYWFVICVFLSGSRNAIISLLLSSITYIIYTIKLKDALRPKALFLIFVYGVALTTTVLWVAQDTSQNPLVTAMTRGEDVDAHSRLFIWATSYSIFVDSSLFNKLFGNGSQFLRIEFRSSHNTYLHILLELGSLFLVGLLLYLAYLIKLILRAGRWRDEKNETAYLLSLLVYVVVSSLFINILFVGVFSICFVILCALTSFVSLAPDRRRKREKLFSSYTS